MLRRRADEFLTGIRVEVTTEMPDNGACHRSRALAEALGESVKHPKTKPCLPQTNGKRERLNRALDAEWAYASVYASEAERAEVHEAWVHDYMTHRPHTGFGRPTPSARVYNLLGKYI